MVDFDRFYMQAALDAAWQYQGLTYPNPAVGAVVVKDGRLLAIAAHQRAGGPHAEVLACKEAYYQLSGDKDILPITESLHLHNYLQTHAKRFLEGATIYVTLEPCFHYGKTPPCSVLLKNLGFKRVVLSVFDPNPNATGGAAYLRQYGVEVVEGVCQKEGEDLIEPFRLWSKKRFIFFKYAQTLNAHLPSQALTSLESRQYVHALRSTIDLLVIGGRTVRKDRPLLDSRLVSGRAPDVLIVSRKKRFNPTIPLFSVPKRKVFIEDSLDKINEYRFIMVEGGPQMLKLLRHKVDWYLTFIAPVMFDKESYKLNKRVEFLHTSKRGGDLVVWSRNG